MKCRAGACPRRCARGNGMEYPKRKHPRLKQYDYSQPGYYYITIHLNRDVPALSYVEPGTAHERAKIHLSAFGEIAKRQLDTLEKRYAHIKIDKYVIMPTHIHAIIRITQKTAGASLHTTVADVVGAYKSLTTRACNLLMQTPGRKLFQTSFYDSVIRNEKMYQQCWKYIDENPEKWLLNPEDV